MSALILITPCGRPASVEQDLLLQASLAGPCARPSAPAQAIDEVRLDRRQLRRDRRRCISSTQRGGLGGLRLRQRRRSPRPRAGSRCACCRRRSSRRRAPSAGQRRCRTRVRILRALPRPLSISRPEWPPRSPVTVTSSPAPPAGAASNCGRPGAGGVAAARAADVQLALVLGVEVQQDRALEEARLEVVRAGEAGLLVDGEQELERPVLERSCPP